EPSQHLDNTPSEKEPKQPRIRVMMPKDAPAWRRNLPGRELRRRCCSSQDGLPNRGAGAAVLTKQLATASPLDQVGGLPSRMPIVLVLSRYSTPRLYTSAPSLAVFPVMLLLFSTVMVPPALKMPPPLPPRGGETGARAGAVGVSACCSSN